MLKVCNTENGAEKLPISRKRKKKLLLEFEKNESKKVKSFQKLLELMNQISQYNQSRQSQSFVSMKNVFIRKLMTKNGICEI